MMENENEKIPHFLKNDNENLNNNISRPPIKNYNEEEDDICNYKELKLLILNFFKNKLK